MDRFLRLHAFLEDTLANPSAESAAAVQTKLERARPHFLSLLDTAPKSPKEREQLEKGTFTYVPTGTAYPVGQGLVKEILFLSDSLSASEDLAASLVSFGINAKPRNVQGRAESGLLVYLDERMSLLRCLQTIWRGALSGDEALSESGLQQVFERETEELTRGKGAEVDMPSAAPGGAKRGPWVEKVMATIDSTKALVDDLRRSLSQPIPNSSLVTATSGGVSFADETTNMRIQRHDDERAALGQLLFLIGAARQFSKNDLSLLLRQLSTFRQGEPIMVSNLVAFLAAIDSSDEGAGAQLYPLFSDTTFISKTKQALAVEWGVPKLRAVVLLQWTVFLTAATHYVPNFESDGGEYVDRTTWQAIEAGVFPFLGRSVLAYKWDSEMEEVWGGIGNEGALTERVGLGVEDWFQDYVTDQVELLIIEVITSKFTVLRKLRNKEEDSPQRSHHRLSRGGQDDQRPREHNLEAFFLLIATIYYNSPDSALKFWEEPDENAPPAAAQLASRLATFLRWGSESRPVAMMRTFYEMVASISSGPHSATYAFEFLSANGNSDGAGASFPFSWITLFNALDYYHTNLPDRPSEAGANADGALGEMPPEEVPLLRSFVRLLRQVVAYSDVARATLYDNQRHRPIATLFSLLGRPVPIELKATLLTAIAAFARPGGVFGVDVARRTWVALEQSQMLPTLAAVEGRDARGGAGMAMGRSGVMRGPAPLTLEGGLYTELEEVEAPNKVYPESTAFVALLNTLIHTPPLNRKASLDIDTHTIPDNLGAPQRPPGIEPYLRFALDDVLLKAGSREFSDPKERWEVTDVCLTFVEKCLASYDLGPFLASVAMGRHNSAASAASLAKLVVHPGFDIVTRLLSGSALLEVILTIVIAGYDAINQNLAGTPLFTRCVLRCMRIVRRTLELQSPFLEIVIPSLGESTTIHIPQDKIGRLSSLAPLDQALLYHPEAVVQIALFVSCEEEDEIALLAVQTLAILADSPFFDVVQRFPEQSRSKINRLVGLIEASPETLRILEGFVGRLAEYVPESDLETGEWDGTKGSIRQAIRSAVLDLLLANTQPDRAGPNIAHLVLGFNIQSRASDMEIDDPDLPETRRTSLHVVLQHLAQNVSSDPADIQVSLLSRHPTFAAKCYRLIRQLCLHQYTSAALSRYLRNREKFFLLQSRAMPFDVPAAVEGGIGEVQYSTGKRVVTSSAAVCAILQSEAWLLESTALELNVLATGSDTQRELELVGALFSAPLVSDDDVPTFFDQDGQEQALPRMLEIFHAFDFAWLDSIPPNDYRLSFFAELNFDSCLKTDATGCEVYDLTSLLALIAAARRELQSRGALNSQAQEEEAKKETRAIVETIVIENHRREIQFARFHALRAWRSLLDITLTKVFHLLPLDGRHNLLLDLMTAILPPLAAPQTDTAISELLSGAAVLLMTKLRDEGVRIAFIEATDSPQSISPERLHVVLKAMLQAILQPGISSVVRGNLYATLLNYIQYSTKLAATSATLSRTLGDDSVMSVAGDDTMSMDGASTIGGSTRRVRRGALETGNLVILQSALDRLLPVICRDAAVGHEVWRTVAFTALDTLLMVAEEGRATSKVLSILSKQGYIQSFVISLKDAEVDILAALEPDPESLNALYVYEAQMSFLVRLASTREGAEKLLSADLLIKLAQCDYLGARPQSDTSSMDFEGFLPPATERHHQILLPALQLVVGTLASFGADTPAATNQAISFVAGQRENLLIALKECSPTAPLASLREAHLIVTLLSIVLPSISEEDMTTLSAFGGLHSALLALSGKICDSQEWVSRVLPSNDTEREESQTLVVSLRHTGTLFSAKVEQVVEGLEAAILTYHSVATRKRAGTNAFRPVWLSTLRLGEHHGAGSSAPSLATATAFLHSLATELSRRLQDTATVADNIENYDELTVDEIEETLGLPEETELDSEDRRIRALQELKSLQLRYRQQVASSLHLLELTLLLYYRHVAFFTDPERAERELTASRPDLGRGLAEALSSRGNRHPGAVDIPALREAISRDFAPVANKLLTLELNAKTAGYKARARETFIATVVRRVKECTEM